MPVTSSQGVKSKQIQSNKAKTSNYQDKTTKEQKPRSNIKQTSLLDRLRSSLQKYRLLFVGLTTVAMVGLVVQYASFDLQGTNQNRIIRLNEGGTTKTMISSANTVGAALDELKVPIAEGDYISPSPYTEIQPGVTDVVIHKALPVKIYDNGKFAQVINTGLSQPREIAASAGIVVFEEDQVRLTGAEDPVQDGIIGQKLDIDRADPIYLNLAGEDIVMRYFFDQNSSSISVADLLNSNHIELEPDDQISVDPQVKIQPGMKIKISRYSQDKSEELIEIDYGEEVIYEHSKPVGWEETRVEGKKGKKLIIYQDTILDGQVTDRQVVSEEVLVEPTSKVVVKGTYTTYSGSVEYWRPYVEQAASKYGADATQLMRVMYCESKGDASNYNGRSSGLTPDQAMAANRAIGLFQYLPSTWYGNGGGDIWDGQQQIEMAARMFANGQAWQWECK